MHKTIYKLILPLLTLFIFTGCTVGTNENVQHVRAYELRAVDDYSKDGIKKIRWFIDAPDAITKEQRAYTAEEAAKDCKKKTSAQECTIIQVATQNAFSYGDLFYSVLVLDKNDQSKAEVSSVLLSRQDYNIGYYYIKLRTTYKDAEPQEFQKAFYHVMINKLKIPENELKLPKIQREEFIIK